MRTIVLTLTTTALVCAPAYAEVRDGLYASGKQKGAGTGVRIAVDNGRFDVERIGFSERCTSPSGSFSQPIRFEKGRKASMEGRIRADGRFRARYSSGGTVFKVKGRFKGNHVKVLGQEHATFTNADGETVRCEGEHRFRAPNIATTAG